jgi:transcriptional regulator with GAF, ATPase, and Fis domain
MLGHLTYLLGRAGGEKRMDIGKRGCIDILTGVERERNGQAVMTDDVRLEALKGPREGETFAFKAGEITIGRDPSNQIFLLDKLVSRRHCIVRTDGISYQIVDLGGPNRTFVNGVAVAEKSLLPGDQIRVGNSMFVLRGVEVGSSTSAVEAIEDLGDSATFVLRKQDALYLQSQGGANLPATARTVRDLKVLVDFSRALNAVEGVAALEEKVLDAVLEASPAERAAIVRPEDAADGFAAVVGRARDVEGEQLVPVSRTILTRVLKENVAVISNDIEGDEDLRDAESLVTARIRSVLAVPLEVQGRVLGAIYLDANAAGVRFDSDLLELLTALGNVAALALENARHVEWLGGEKERLEQELNIEHDMVGESEALAGVKQFIGRAAPQESTVLIWGESGTGKELVARAIYQNSARASKPFVAINCAAITDTLLESELFGHEKGAFTSAVAMKKGKLEMAEGGTVFLDEIGELAPGVQAKLLRVLQEHEFERVGGVKTIPLDIRVIAATNRDLKEAAEKKEFRLDLYYRLNVVSVKMPALRERRKDIPILASYFVKRCAEKMKRDVRGISAEARACLMAYDWPGNVRELENAIERAVVLGSSEMILPEDLPESIAEHAGPDGHTATALHDGVRQAKKVLIERAIDQAGGNYTEAAKLLGVHANHLFRLIKSLDMSPKRKRA